MRTHIGSLAMAALIAFAMPGTTGTSASPPATHAVFDWNDAVFDVTTAAEQNAIIASHAAAMMHVAIHDALNAIERRHEPYVYQGRAEADSVPDAAIAAAGHDVLVAVLPGFPHMTAEQKAKASQVVEAVYSTAKALAAIPAGPAREHGLAAGKEAAKAVVNLRKDDKRDATVTYTPGTTPGLWRPHPNPSPANPPIEDPAKAPGNAPPVLPHWGSVTPFTMAAPWQFRMPPPPALNTAAYAKDFDEVKRLGGKNSTERTPEQTEIAKAWYDGSPHHWSRIARIVATERKIDAWDQARLLALVNMAVADGYIAGADTRYLYNYWRPVTAIRAADSDGNDATQPDPAWESLLNTPALPDYPSTHSVCSGAAAVVLARFFGSDTIEIVVPSGPPFPGIKRSFHSFTDIAKEVCDSRVYNGVHFRTACTEGMKLGQEIGRRAVATYLRPFTP